MADVKQGFLDESEIFRPEDAAAASRAQRRGELRRLARGLYTWNLDEPPEQLLRRRWMDVAALYFPDAVLVDRSAVEARAAEDGSVFLDSGPQPANPTAVRLPGLVLRPRAGPGPVAGDMQFGLLHRSGEARTALDNMRPSRARSGVARTLAPAELEGWLERIARNRGEDDLLRIRDEAREIAPALASSLPTSFSAPCARRGASTRPCPRASPGRSSRCSRSARYTPSPTATAASPAPCSTPS